MTESQNGFARLTPERAREAYLATGLKPMAYRIFDGNGRACVLGALAVQVSPEARDSAQAIWNAVDHILRFPLQYQVGVANGFNGEFPKPGTASELYSQGYDDGCAAREAVFAGTAPLAPELVT